jgi:hypothetical protein
MSPVILSVVYLVVHRLQELAVLLGRSEASKEVEILVLRHELAVLPSRHRGLDTSVGTGCCQQRCPDCCSGPDGRSSSSRRRPCCAGTGIRVARRWTLWVPITCSGLRDLRMPVLVDQPAEPLPADDEVADGGWRRASLIRPSLSERAMRAVGVVVIDVDGHDPSELPSVDDEDPVQQFAAHAADPIAPQSHSSGQPGPVCG